MDDEQLADLHRFLAEYHRRLAKEAILDVVQQYHSDLAQRLADEAALIPRRTAIAQRLREGEQRITGRRMNDGAAAHAKPLACRMGGAQPYPSTPAYDADGFRFALPILRTVLQGVGEYDFVPLLGTK